MEQSLFSRLSPVFRKKSVLLLGVVFCIGALLLLLLPEKEGGTGVEETALDREAYLESLEQRTQELIGHLDGVGEVHVMITIESFSETHYANDSTVQEYAGEESQDALLSQTIVMQTEKSGARTPAVSHIEEAKVRGVSVVCDGGGDARVRLKIINLLQALFDLESNDISVTN